MTALAMKSWMKFLILLSILQIFIQLAQASNRTIQTGTCEVETINGNSGYVTSPNFPGNYDDEHFCYTILSPHQGKRILINFLMFELENNCSHDNLTINIGSVPYGPYCGNDTLPTFSSSENVTISFRSDASISHQGFRMRWRIIEDVCGDYELSGESGYLTSPNFPGSYDNNLDCSKTISPPSGKRVEINFLTVHIENERDCSFDQLTLTVGDEKFSGADFCGNHVPRDFTTDENVTISFQTDDSEVSHGFQIYWEILDDCDGNSFRCWDGSCIQARQKCDGNTDCLDQSDEIECAHSPSSYGECGKNPASISFTWNAKIVGGNQAQQNSYPWIVPLFDQENLFFCSATIISERWLLTAAHCTEKKSPSDVFGLLGTNDRTDFLSTLIDFDQVINHPNYTEVLYLDIALLHTTQPIVFTDQISPVCIPHLHDSVNVGEVCVAIGWGDLYFNSANDLPDLLRQVRLPLLNNSICRTTYTNITDAHICAGDYDKGGPATCQGDSGGPLVCFKDGSWVQFGVTSYGFGCGFPENPDVFTDVRSYHNWIQENLSPVSATSSGIDICGDNEILGHSGDLISPNYPGNYNNDLDCSKTLSPTPPYDATSEPLGRWRWQLRISFLSFKLEDSTECVFDNITITIGNETYGTFCGNNIPSIITTEEDVRIRFRSDYTSVLQGFLIHWEIVTGTEPTTLPSPTSPTTGIVTTNPPFTIPPSTGTEPTNPPLPSTTTPTTGIVTTNPPFTIPPSTGVDICGNNTVVGRNGTLTSPNFPGSYENNHDCYTTLRPPPGKSIEIIFLTFELENHGNCAYDSLTITVGNETYGGSSFCGSNIPPNFITYDDVTIRFVTDGSVVRQGFRIYWEINADMCDGDDVDEHSGYITSPNFPENYHNNEYCFTNLSPPPGKMIFVAFETFDLENNTDCRKDNLTITVGGSVYEGSPFCGREIPRNFTTNEDVTIVFITDDNISNHSGFLIRWEVINGTEPTNPPLPSTTSPTTGIVTTNPPFTIPPSPVVDICGNNTVVGRNGTLTSPNFPGSYENNHNCSITIRPPPGKSIEIMFLTFELENHGNCAYDSLTITIGNETYGGSSFCGSNIPPNFITYHDVTIRFVTDGSAVRQGFRIYWEINAGSSTVVPEITTAPTTTAPTTTTATTTTTTTASTTTTTTTTTPTTTTPIITAETIVSSLRNLWNRIITSGNPFAELFSTWWNRSHRDVAGSPEKKLN